LIKEDAMADDLYVSELEKHFPRILKNIEYLWSDIGLRPYFDKLVLDDRAGDGPARQGFPPEGMEEIMLLASVNRLLHPAGWRGDDDATRPANAF
jgi:hypothetical protein